MARLDIVVGGQGAAQIGRAAERVDVAAKASARLAVNMDRASDRAARFAARMRQAGAEIRNAVGALGRGLGGAGRALGGVFSGGIFDIPGNIIKGVTGAAGALASAGAEAVGSLARGAASAVSAFVSLGGNIAGAIGSGITGAVGLITGAFEGIVGAAAGAVSAVGEALGEAFGKAFRVGALAGIGAAIFAVQRALRSERLERGFQRLAGGVEEAEEALESFRQATRGTVADGQLILQFNRALALGAVENADQFAKLTEAAIVLGREVGRGAAESVEDLTLGLGRQSKLILDNLGLIVPLNQAYKDFADRVGTTVAALSDQDKRLAFSQAAWKAIQDRIDQAGDTAGDTLETWEQLTASIQNLAARIGRTLLPIVRELFTRLRDAAEATADWVDANQAAILDAMTSAAERLGSAIQTVVDVISERGLGGALRLVGDLAVAAFDRLAAAAESAFEQISAEVDILALKIKTTLAEALDVTGIFTGPSIAEQTAALRQGTTAEQLREQDRQRTFSTIRSGGRLRAEQISTLAAQDFGDAVQKFLDGVEENRRAAAEARAERAREAAGAGGSGGPGGPGVAGRPGVGVSAPGRGSAVAEAAGTSLAELRSLFNLVENSALDTSTEADKAISVLRGVFRDFREDYVRIPDLFKEVDLAGTWRRLGEAVDEADREAREAVEKAAEAFRDLAEFEERAAEERKRLAEEEVEARRQIQANTLSQLQQVGQGLRGQAQGILGESLDPAAGEGVPLRFRKAARKARRERARQRRADFERFGAGLTSDQLAAGGGVLLEQITGQVAAEEEKRRASLAQQLEPFFTELAKTIPAGQQVIEEGAASLITATEEFATARDELNERLLAEQTELTNTLTAQKEAANQLVAKWEELTRKLLVLEAEWQKLKNRLSKTAGAGAT